MKSSTELIKATDEAVNRLVIRNINEKGKPDRYAIGAMDGYIQGYCDCAAEELGRYEQAKEDGELLAYRCEERAKQETIDKVCQYLRDHIDPKLTIYHNETWCSLDKFIEKLQKSNIGITIKTK